MSEDKEVSRRWFLVGVGVVLNGAVALLIATPVIGYLLGSIPFGITVTRCSGMPKMSAT